MSAGSEIGWPGASTVRPEDERKRVQAKRGRRPPPFSRRERSAYRFLPAFFFPPLAFFAIVFYPPLQVGFCANAHAHHRGCRPARSRKAGARRVGAPPAVAEGAARAV